MAIIATGSKTIIDLSDGKSLSVYLGANQPRTQIHDVNASTYSPDWTTTAGKLTVTPVVYANQTAIALSNTALTITWKRKDGSAAEAALISGETVSGKALTVNKNNLATATSKQLTYIAYVAYVDPDTGLTINATADITFALLTTGEDAKSAWISGEQVFKYTAAGAVSPAQITLTANLQNVTMGKWQYKNSSGNWTDYPTTSDNASITGTTLIVKPTHSVFVGQSATLRITTSDANVSDTTSIYKVQDGAPGGEGSPGQNASVVFLTNESITYAGTKDGKVAANTKVCNVVAYTGTTKVTPTIGTPTGMPTGMTITVGTASDNEIPLTITITANSTLGAAGQLNGVVNVPVTAPVETTLQMLLSTTPFDVTKPILYVGTKYTTSALTQTNNYISWGTAFSLASTVSGFSGTAGATVYIKGTLNGNMFTPAAGVLTTTVPTTEDGYTYILLGLMSTTVNAVLAPEHPMFRYYNGGFKTISQISYEAFMTAQEAQEAVDNLEIGGRNYILNSSSEISDSTALIARYALSEAMVAGDEYTISLTLTPMESYEGLTVRTSGGDKTLATIDLSGVGRQIVQATFIAEYASGKSPDDDPDNGDILIYRKPASAGTASTIIHQIKLEKGNRATDWTAAPEDAEEVLEQKLSSVRAQISTEADSIRSEVQATYALASDMTQVTQQVSTLSEQTQSNYTWAVTRINQLQQDLTDTHAATEEELAIFRTYMSFDEQGLVIGKTGNPFTFRVVNDRLAFYMNDTEMAYLSNNKLYVTQAEILTKLIIGKFAFEPQANGNLSLMRAKDTPRPVVFRDSALKAQIASVLGWETFDADRMFETLSGISVNMDMVTLHFKDGGAKQFRYIQPKQIHRKRKETT